MGRFTGAEFITDFTTLGSVTKVGDKNPAKQTEKYVLVSPPRQDVIHPSLSGSRCQPDLESGCFLHG